MKTNKVVLLVLCFFIFTSFNDTNKKIEGIILVKGKIIINKWLIPNGNIRFFIETNENNSIKSLSVGGYVFGFSEIGTILVSDLEKDTINQLHISDRIDKMISIFLDKDFSEKGGAIYLNIQTIDSLRSEKIYLSSIEDKFVMYLDTVLPSKELTNFHVNYAWNKGIITYKPVTIEELENNK